MNRIEVVKVQVVREKIMYYEGSKCIRSPKDAADILREYIGNEDREHFVIMMLSTKNTINAIHTTSIGSLSSAIVHPREVFKAAVLANASSIVLGHNHPSGDPTPSPEDIEATKRLSNAGDLMGIDVLDHVIIGDGRFYSLKERGLL